MQSLLKSFYKDNADAAFLGSSDGKIYAANLTAQILFTMSEADLLRTNFSELVDPTDQRLRVFLEERSAKGTHRGRLRMQTGKGRTFEAEVTSWFADQDKVWFSVKDITDQIEEQEQLQIRELHLRQMAESIREVFWVMDPDQMLYISPAYEDVFGRPTAEFYQRPDAFIDVIHPDDRERIRSAFKEHFTTGFFQDEYRIVRTDGSIRWIFSRGFPVEQKGIFYRTAGIAEDITERKDLENVLRFQSQIVQQVHDSVIATDCEGKITFWNNGAERLFGYSTEEAIGQNVSFLIVDAAAVPRILETLLTKQWLDLDILLKRRSGETFTGFLSLSILKNTE
ncbi:MAG: PAS domain S-box protein, partial [Desulfovibrionales bacterium]